MREFTCLLRLYDEDLDQVNFLNHQRQLWKDFEKGYNGTLVIVRSDFGKEFAFYIPE